MDRHELSPADLSGRGLRAVGSNQRLSERELEVLCLLRHGFSCPGVGLKLGITPRTVRAHLKAIKVKLAAATAAHCVARGFEQGLLVASQACGHAAGDCQ